MNIIKSSQKFQSALLPPLAIATAPPSSPPISMVFIYFYLQLKINVKMIFSFHFSSVQEGFELLELYFEELANWGECN